MFISISALVPNVTDLLRLEVEEVGAVLLVHLVSCDDDSRHTGVFQNGLVIQRNFFNDLNQRPPYPDHKDQLARVLMEGWAWLEREGLLVRDSEQPSPCFFLSRRAKRLKTFEDIAAYRKASLLPKGQLHPLIAVKVYPAFLRGEYDTAVFQAFRELEIVVRKTGRFGNDEYGTDLMRDAFRPVNPDKSGVAPGPLTDLTLPVAEQEAMAHLFAGAIGLYKNPQSHRNVPTEALDAAEVIGFASHMLRIVDGLASRLSESKQ